VKRAHDHFGRLNIVVNNAGYGQFGFVEELSESGSSGNRSRSWRRASYSPWACCLRATRARAIGESTAS
jgi:NAD(P)-dependent dehydrogenase (short-subunit alcohol dehydrogenase family)